MVKKHQKLLCLVLCLALILSAVLMSTVSAFAGAGDTVYLKVSGWSTPYCYMWNGTGETKNHDFPGEAMTKVSDGIYSYTLKASYANIIFSNNGSPQTMDMTYPGHGKIYDYSANSWGDYEGAPTQPVGQDTTTAPVNPGSGTTVYLKNSVGWTQPKCYMWNSSSDTNTGWPGDNMTSVGDDVWMYSASKSFANCIFNGGGDDTKTGDLTARDGYIFDNKTNEWSIYDTSDLQVRSFTADPQTGIYPGTEVELSTNAVSKTGATVSFKFSVTNSSGNTTVIQDFGAGNTARWTPTAVGSYTIVFDYSDTAGNTNSRELALTVDDDSSLVKPVIKSISPSPANLIRRNASTTVTLNAGGGKTGTNLLFYKFVIEDPDGGKNTAYYTLSSNYTFTPTIVGDYKVTAYAQGSDNSTVNKTYTYTVTNSDITNPPTTAKPTVPQLTTVKPTTAPVTTVKPTTKPVATTAKPTTAPVTTKPVATTTKATVKPTQPVYTKIWGDANGDGKVNVKDVTYMQKHIAKYPEATYIDLDVVDFDIDFKVTISDVTMLQKYINSI